MTCGTQPHKHDAPKIADATHDALGSVRKVTDATGTVVATFDTDAWERELASTSDSIPNGGLRYRFVGALGVRLDETTGLYYMRQRWYDAGLQRFMSRDPLGQSFSGVNLYAYVDSNPATRTDPSGLG